MTAQRRTVIHCDHPGCPEMAYGPSAEKVREHAKRSGWRVNVEAGGRARHDYCHLHTGGRA